MLLVTNAIILGIAKGEIVAVAQAGWWQLAFNFHGENYFRILTGWYPKRASSRVTVSLLRLGTP